MLQGHQTQRLTLRQAIVVLPEPMHGPWSMDTRVTVLTDLLAAAGAADGVTVVLVPGGIAPATADGVPAGVDIMPVGERDLGQVPRIVFAILRERAFQRVVFVAGDAVGVPTRLYSTALGGLSDAAAIAAMTPGGSLALLSVAERTDLDALEAAGWLRALGEGGAAKLPAPTLSSSVRYLDRRARLGELDGAEELVEAAAVDRSASYRLQRLLARSAAGR